MICIINEVRKEKRVYFSIWTLPFPKQGTNITVHGRNVVGVVKCQMNCCLIAQPKVYIGRGTMINLLSNFIFIKPQATNNRINVSVRKEVCRIKAISKGFRSKDEARELKPEQTLIISLENFKWYMQVCLVLLFEIACTAGNSAH